MMTQITKEQKTTNEIISHFESVSGEILWRDSQVALGSTINTLVVLSMKEKDPIAFILHVAEKLQNEFTEK